MEADLLDDAGREDGSGNLEGRQRGKRCSRVSRRGTSSWHVLANGVAEREKSKIKGKVESVAGIVFC